MYIIQNGIFFSYHYVGKWELALNLIPVVGVLKHTNKEWFSPQMILHIHVKSPLHNIHKHAHQISPTQSDLDALE